MISKIRNIFGLVLSVCLFTTTVSQIAICDDLTAALQNEAQESKSKVSTERAAIMQRSIDALGTSKIVDRAPKVGDVLPDESFLDAHGKSTSLYEVLGGGPAIVTFYRGGWCPYCNLQLHSYASHLKEIELLGAKLVAITPEKPDAVLSTKEKDEITFPVLSDVGNKYAHTLRIVFKLDPELKDLYKAFGIDLEANQGTDVWELPLAATFVVDSKRVIQYAFVDVDYKKRAAPTTLIGVLEEIKAKK